MAVKPVFHVEGRDTITPFFPTPHSHPRALQARTYKREKQQSKHYQEFNHTHPQLPILPNPPQ